MPFNLDLEHMQMHSLGLMRLGLNLELRPKN